jgi:hypothetical protein
VHCSRSIFVLVGEDVVVELAEPTGDGPLHSDMAQFHHGIYAPTFKVRDLADAQHYLQRKGVKIAFTDGTTAVTDPTTTHGCVMAFTTTEITDDPRTDWTDHTDGPIPAHLFRPA